jgi:hypothetical protein
MTKMLKAAHDHVSCWERVWAGTKALVLVLNQRTQLGGTFQPAIVPGSSSSKATKTTKTWRA